MSAPNQPDAASEVVREAIPEYASDDISHLEGLAGYLDNYARDKRRERLPASADLFELIARHLRTYDAARLASLSPAQPEVERCEHCDGTGDIHRADGEWLGTCPCATPTATHNAEALREALRKADAAINSAFMQADAEQRGHDRIADRHDKIVREGRAAIRSALDSAEVK